MLSNAYFVAKFRFDTAENEPHSSFVESEVPAPKEAQKTGPTRGARGAGPQCATFFSFPCARVPMLFLTPS